MEFSSHRKARLRKQPRSVMASEAPFVDECGEELLAMSSTAASGGCNGGLMTVPTGPSSIGVGVTSFSSPSRRPLLQPGASLESTSSFSEHSTTLHNNLLLHNVRAGQFPTGLDQRSNFCIFHIFTLFSNETQKNRVKHFWRDRVR